MKFSTIVLSLLATLVAAAPSPAPQPLNLLGLHIPLLTGPGFDLSDLPILTGYTSGTALNPIVLIGPILANYGAPNDKVVDLTTLVGNLLLSNGLVSDSTNLDTIIPSACSDEALAVFAIALNNVLTGSLPPTKCASVVQQILALIQHILDVNKDDEGPGGIFKRAPLAPPAVDVAGLIKDLITVIEGYPTSSPSFLTVAGQLNQLTYSLTVIVSGSAEAALFSSGVDGNVINALLIELSNALLGYFASIPITTQLLVVVSTFGLSSLTLTSFTCPPHRLFPALSPSLALPRLLASLAPLLSCLHQF